MAELSRINILILIISWLFRDIILDLRCLSAFGICIASRDTVFGSRQGPFHGVSSKVTMVECRWFIFIRSDYVDPHHFVNYFFLIIL